jgi:hypothetical protein
VSGPSPATGLKNGQFNRKSNKGIKNPKSQAPNFKQLAFDLIQSSIFNSGLSGYRVNESKIKNPAG